MRVEREALGAVEGGQPDLGQRGPNPRGPVFLGLCADVLVWKDAQGGIYFEDDRLRCD
jgi:hypothetical protein